MAQVLTNKPMVVHLLNEDIYLAVRFTFWTGQVFLNAGKPWFSYVRLTSVASAVPTVSITNPVANAVFEAPASVSLAANANVGIGTVTNVEYFAGTTSLGHAAVSPFSVT